MTAGSPDGLTVARRTGRAGTLTSALTCALIVVDAGTGATPASAAELEDACRRDADQRVVCRFATATTSPVSIDVPDGVTSAVMVLRGGAGGPGGILAPVPGLAQSPGGGGGIASASIPLDPGQDLDVRVGGAGQPGLDGGNGGTGGGGSGNTLSFVGLGLMGGGGGGGSEVRVAGSNPSGADPLIAAGGGGGGGSGFLGTLPTVLRPGPGGAGGGTTGAPAPGVDPGEAFGGLLGGLLGGGGGGGTPTAGGEAGGLVLPGLPPVMGGSGVRGQGGHAGMASIPSAFEDGIGGGGGGGGGYFGGAAGSLFAGGGGGSGFGPDGTTFGTDPTGLLADATSPDGAVVIVFAPPELEKGFQKGSERGSAPMDSSPIMYVMSTNEDRRIPFWPAGTPAATLLATASDR